ncbi:hypothetical protein FBEOM_5542 [Fusarium beomiforme]|uniref:Uncharacterized protein n=1 Tax=Fusarium beomiforme TaxID=44412 RepID=A0A9P5AL48_9HYPO|nr:hypothetical protein FBEOM_5542 [Fusarium beomiforme]
MSIRSGVKPFGPTLFLSKDGPSRESGRAGYELNPAEVPGRENLVEALDDFEVEDDRCSDHLGDNIQTTTKP